MRWPLPDAPHIPGQTPRPATSPAFEAARAAPAVTQPANWQRNAAYIYGFRLYEADFFWEAHEVWEPVWMNASPNSRARALLQGLIQLANACLKLRMARPRAAGRLLDIAHRHAQEAGAPPLMGLVPTLIAAEISRFSAHPDISRKPVPRLKALPGDPVGSV